METIILALLPNNEKVTFERNKIHSFGTRTVLDGIEFSYIFYDGQEIPVAETYDELKEKIK